MALRPLNLRLMRPCQFQPAWRLCNVLPAVARSGAGLRVPARLTLYSVLDHWSEGYSYLVGRSGEQTLLDKLRDTYGKALEFAVAGVTQDLEPRTVLLKGATVEVFAALGPDDIEVLVYGSPGYGPVRRVLLGGVSSRLIRRARLPVTVVPRASTASTD